MACGYGLVKWLLTHGADTHRVDTKGVTHLQTAASMGHLGQPSHPEVIVAIDAAMKRIHATGKPSGFLTGDEKLARHYLDLGCQFVAVGADLGLLARAADALSARFKPAPLASGQQRSTAAG